MSGNPLVKGVMADGPVYRLILQDGVVVGREKLEPQEPKSISQVIGTLRPKHYRGGRNGKRWIARKHNL